MFFRKKKLNILLIFLQYKYVTDTVAPRLAEIQPIAVNGEDTSDVVVGGKPFPPLQNSPDVTPTGISYENYENIIYFILNVLH